VFRYELEQEMTKNGILLGVGRPRRRVWASQTPGSGIQTSEQAVYAEPNAQIWASGRPKRRDPASQTPGTGKCDFASFFIRLTPERCGV
jgi:hypothetical protein